MYRGQTEIRDAYRDERVASQYIERRFHSPLFALLHDRQLTFLRNLVSNERPRRVLEIAPGPARLTASLAPHISGSLTLVDASAQMLAEARRRLPDGRASCVHGDAFRLPFSTAFDLVYTFRLLRHFEARDRSLLCREIARVTRKGSYLVFDAVNEVVSRPQREAAPEEYRHFDALMDPRTIREELDAAGFELVSLVGVQHRFPAMKALQVFVAPRSTRMARWAMEVVDRLGGQPLEWIVLCRRV
jgi:ubiquinone/menaquinone biosynthesis C-methylase UbiE